MNIKKYIFIGIGVFVAIIIVSMGISSRFSLSNIATNPFGFIENFFVLWSPALTAAGTLIAAILAFLAIYDSRRSQKLAMLDQQYYKIEEWVRDNAEAFSKAKHIISLLMVEDKQKKELESEHELLEQRKKALEGETGAEKTEIEIIERLVEINKQLIAINERSIDYAKKGIEEMVEIAVKVARSDITIKPLISSIGDVELTRIYDYYTKLANEKIEALREIAFEDSANIYEDAINEMQHSIQNLLWYIYYLRNRMISQ